MMGWQGGGMTMFAWMGMGLFWLAVLGLVVWLVVRLLPGKSQGAQLATGGAMLPSPTNGASAVSPALAILDDRLARGEVDVDTYRTIRATLVEGREVN